MPAPEPEYDYDVVFTQQAELLARKGDLDHPHVMNIGGKVLATSIRTKRASQVGEFSAIRFKYCPGRIHDEADAHSQHAYDVANAFYDSRGHLRPAVEKQFPDYMSNGFDLLYAHSLKLEPKARGVGLGLAVVSRFLDHFEGGAGLAVIKPFPLQFEHWASRDESLVARVREKVARYGRQGFTDDRKMAFEKLTQYWARLGFQKVSRTQYMALDLSLSRE